MTVTIQDRWLIRGTLAADAVSGNPTPLDREMWVEMDTGRTKIGNGADAWNTLLYTNIGPIDLTGLADGNTIVFDSASGTWKVGAGGGAGGDDFAVASGTDTITATFGTAPTLTDGQQFKVRAAGANTSTAPTFNPNSLGALTLYKLGGQALAAGDISGAGHELIIRYRDTPARYELVNPAGVQTPQGGNHINVDSTDPRKPVIAVTGLSAGAGYAEGTSFPGAPGLNDKFYRNDLNLLCYYDGMRWLTVQEYAVSMANNGSGDSTPPVLRGITLGTNIYFTHCSQSIRVPGTNNSTNYVTTEVSWSDGTDNNTIVLSDTKADNFGTGNTFVFKTFSVNAVAMGVREIEATIKRVGSSGNPYSILQIGYRLIVT